MGIKASAASRAKARFMRTLLEREIQSSTTHTTYHQAIQQRNLKFSAATPRGFCVSAHSKDS
jgi:hypothetical protein